MDEARSKIAQYIAGDLKLDQLIDSHRISVPVQKRFMFEDIWITMNRKIGEAVISSAGNTTGSGASEYPKKWKPTVTQERRRNAVTIVDPQGRLMTNGRQWPKMEDWVVSADNKIRYAPMLQPLRQLGQDEWTVNGVEAPTEALLVSAPPMPLQDHHSPVSHSNLSERTYRTYGDSTPTSYNPTNYMDSTS